MSLLSALWLVDDSAAVSLRYVLTHDWMTTFCVFSVSSFCCSSCCFPCHLMVDTCAVMDIRTSQAIDRSRRHHTLQLTFLTDLNLLYCGKPSEVVPSFPFGSGAASMSLFSGLGTDVHFSGDETGLQWEDYLFELQNAVEWRMVMSRGQDERSQMHAMSLLLNTCEVMTIRVLIDDGARWILQGDEQERENRTAGVKALKKVCWRR